jgi:hypothetical protein
VSCVSAGRCAANGYYGDGNWKQQAFVVRLDLLGPPAASAKERQDARRRTSRRRRCRIQDVRFGASAIPGIAQISADSITPGQLDRNVCSSCCDVFQGSAWLVRETGA